MFVNLEMEMKRLGRYIVLVLVLIILVVCQVKAIVDIQNRPSSPSVDTTENLVELLWANCGLDMKYLKEAYNSADSRIIGTSATNMLKEENLMKLLSVLPRKNQAVILDCLKEKAPVSLLSEDDESSPGWYLKFIDSLVSNFYRPAQYRRHLADENAVASDSEVESINVAIVISVVVTAIVTFIFALLLFLFCHKHLGINISKYYENDKPLLGISTSDYSTGSTNSPDFQNSSHKMSFQSCCSTISDKEQATSSEENVESDVVNVSVDRADTLPAEETMSIDSKIPPQPINSPPEKILPPPKLPPSKALPEPPPPLASPCAPAPPPPPPPRRQSSGGGSPSPPGPPPPPVVGSKPGVSPPPLPKGVVQPPAPPNVGSTNSSRTKLKPFFWDKVLTHPGHAMVWNQIKAGSFQFNEEMIETLFGYVPPDKNKMFPHKESSAHDAPKFIQLIDRKKEQNLSILMRALNITTEEVCDALEHGNELPPEFLETLLKMAPTPEEELKLRLFSGELSQLGPTERFLKVLVDIPYAIQRMEALHFMCTLEEEVKTIKESFLTLEAACNELRDNRLFLKLLEAVLKTGNRMNDGTFRGGAQAFKLDTLLKLSDVKGVDGKITLLHFVVTEIIRSEGIRAGRGDGTNTSFSSAKSIDNFIDDQSEDDFEEKLRTLGLQVVSHLSREMEDVKKAAGLDGEILSASVAKLGRSMTKTRNFLNLEMKNIDEENGFHQVLKCFVEEIDGSVMLLVEEEKRIVEVMKSTADYFHGKPTKEEGLRLFSIVKDFLVMLDKACAQIAEQFKKSSNSCSQTHKKDSLSGKSSSDEQPPSKESPPKQNYTDTPLQLPPDVGQRFMKAIARGQEDVDSSSEDEDD